MKELTITWQRLLDEREETCSRCGTTEEAVEAAAKDLSQALKPLGIEVKLQKKSLTFQEFRGDPAQSNRIWIAHEPMEKWLEASSGESPCCGPCGDAQCRTVTVGEVTYEAIPRELIVKAGMLAAAEILGEPQGCGCEKETDKPSGCC